MPITHDDKQLIEIDEHQLAIILGQVLAKEIGAMTKDAINQALGRLD